MAPFLSPWSPWSQLSNKILAENWLVRPGMGMEGRNQVVEECGGNDREDGGGKAGSQTQGKLHIAKHLFSETGF